MANIKKRVAPKKTTTRPKKKTARTKRPAWLTKTNRCLAHLARGIEACRRAVEALPHLPLIACVTELSAVDAEMRKGLAELLEHRPRASAAAAPKAKTRNTWETPGGAPGRYVPEE